MSARILALVGFASASALAASPLKLVNTYSGQGFFDGFSLAANATDPSNMGNIHYVNGNTALNGPPQLAFVNKAGNVILRVDNVTNDPGPPGPYDNFGRNTVKAISNQPIDINTLVVASLSHIPFGCSVWPAFWTLDANTQTDMGGEIDIIEPVNLQTVNQYSLHTRSGCTLSNSSSFPHTGTQTQTNCDGFDFAATDNEGCVIKEPTPNSVGPKFAGGVYAMYWSTNGVQMWFFPASSIPSDLSSNSPNPSTWPTPSASYPASTCDPNTYFVPQNLIFDIDICGQYAGKPDVFSETCSNMGLCTDLVAKGVNYDNAYWEINYVKTFTGAPDAIAFINTSSTAAASSTASSSTSSSSSSSGNNSSGSGSSSSSGAVAVDFGSLKIICSIVGTVFASTMALVL